MNKAHINILRQPLFYLACSGLILATGMILSLADTTSVSPWLRIVTGLLVLILPGGYLFVLVPTRKSWDLIDFVGYGFAFSIALITLLGIITRTLSWSIDTVEFIWYALSLLGFAAVFIKTRSLPSLNLQVRGSSVALLVIILLQVALYAHSSVFSTPTTDDQNRHHAAVNGFLREEPLGWREPYYETDNLIADRMYLTYWVLAQALVVEISNVPILLTRYFINPFVMIMSVAAMYIFARNLGHRQRTALIYVVLGLLAYSLGMESGSLASSEFFNRSLLDKIVAAFALAPIAISSAYLCSVSGSRNAFIGFGLSFLAAASVHSIPGGFAACIIGIWCLLRLVTEEDGQKNAIQIGLLTLVLFSPAILVRLTTLDNTIYNFVAVLPEDTSKKIFVFDAINPLDYPNRFFAINSLSAGDLTYILIALVLLSLLARRLVAQSKLMLAYSVAIAIGLLPFTAWIYGKLVSFNHVVRILWLMPYGYMLGFCLETAWSFLSSRVPQINPMLDARGRERLLISLSLLALPATLHFIHFSPRVDFSRDIANATAGDHELLEIAQYIDSHHEDRVWIATSPEYRNRTVAIGWKAILLSRFSPERMAYYSNLPLEQTTMQSNDNLRLYKADVEVAEKLAIVDRYDIDYLLFPKGYAWMVDPLYQTDRQRFELVYSGETLRLVRVHY